MYRMKVVTRENLLDLRMDVIAGIKESQDALRLATRRVFTGVANCMAVDCIIFENVFY